MSSRGTKAAQEVRMGTEEALFIYRHKRAHLYICPYNFILLSACTKMVKNSSPAADVLAGSV